MALTPAQLTTLKSAIAAETDPTFAQYRSDGSTGMMAEWLNGASNSDAWRPDMTARDLDEASDITAFDSVSAGKRDSWRLFLDYAPRDMSRNRCRKAVTDVWGNATAGSVSEGILQASTRKATRGEKIVGGTATASTGTVTAINLTWTGRLRDADVVLAINS